MEGRRRWKKERKRKSREELKVEETKGEREREGTKKDCGDGGRKRGERKR